MAFYLVSATSDWFTFETMQFVMNAKKYSMVLFRVILFMEILNLIIMFFCLNEGICMTHRRSVFYGFCETTVYVVTHNNIKLKYDTSLLAIHNNKYINASIFCSSRVYLQTCNVSWRSYEAFYARLCKWTVKFGFCFFVSRGDTTEDKFPWNERLLGWGGQTVSDGKSQRFCGTFWENCN